MQRENIYDYVTTEYRRRIYFSVNFLIRYKYKLSYKYIIVD